MRDFTIDDIVNEIYDELGFTGSKTVLKNIIRHHFKRIIKIMKSKRDRIMLKENDIMTIYTNPDIKELMGKVADVDETRVIEFENGFAIKNEKFRDPYRHQKIASRKARKNVEHLPKLNA
jgi:hypothetical protein